MKPPQPWQHIYECPYCHRKFPTEGETEGHIYQEHGGQ